MMPRPRRRLAGDSGQVMLLIFVYSAISLLLVTVVIGASLSSGFASDVQARNVQVDGLEAVEVTVTAPLPVIGLFGPSGMLVISGHGAQEPP